MKKKITILLAIVAYMIVEGCGTWPSKKPLPPVPSTPLNAGGSSQPAKDTPAESGIKEAEAKAKAEQARRESVAAANVAVAAEVNKDNPCQNTSTGAVGRNLNVAGQALPAPTPDDLAEAWLMSNEELAGRAVSAEAREKESLDKLASSERREKQAKEDLEKFKSDREKEKIQEGINKQAWEKQHTDDMAARERAEKEAVEAKKALKELDKKHTISAWNSCALGLFVTGIAIIGGGLLICGMLSKRLILSAAAFCGGSMLMYFIERMIENLLAWKYFWLSVIGIILLSIAGVGIMAWEVWQKHKIKSQGFKELIAGGQKFKDSLAKVADKDGKILVSDATQIFKDSHEKAQDQQTKQAIKLIKATTIKSEN